MISMPKESENEYQLIIDAISGTLAGFKRRNPNLRDEDKLKTIIAYSILAGMEIEKRREKEDWKKR